MASRGPTFAFFAKLHHLPLQFFVFSIHKILMIIWPSTAKIIIEKLYSFRHIAKLDVKADAIVCLADLLQGF